MKNMENDKNHTVELSVMVKRMPLLLVRGRGKS